MLFSFRKKGLRPLDWLNKRASKRPLFFLHSTRILLRRPRGGAPAGGYRLSLPNFKSKPLNLRLLESIEIVGFEESKAARDKPQNTPRGYPLGPPPYIYVVIDSNTRGRPPGTPLKSCVAIEL